MAALRAAVRRTGPNEGQYTRQRGSTPQNGSQSPIARDWDTPGLPDRHTWHERCRHHHGLCAFRDDDPARCPGCHRLRAACSGCTEPIEEGTR